MHLETPWPTLTRRIHDYFGTRFDLPMAELEMGFWKASPGDIWFMGDRLDTDVAGAKTAGMTAVWLNPTNRPDPTRSADITVADWDTFVRRILAASRATA